MQSSARRAAFVAGAACLLSMALAGCAGLGAAAAPELVVRQLATQRWQALLAQDFNQAYAFASPAYRQIHTPDYYRSQRQQTPVKWIAAEVLRVDCAGEKCTVRIQLESKPVVPFPFRGTITSGIDETWVLENQQWWMLEPL